MENIKSLKVAITLEGKGVVQFDSNDLGHAVNAAKNTKVKPYRNGKLPKNISFAKSSFKTERVNGEEKITRQLKISADGLRHGIHIEEHPFHSPNVFTHELLKLNYLSNLGTLQRGYLITGTGERRKSPYCISPAEEVSGALPVLEFHSNSESKQTRDENGKVIGKDENDRGSTSLFSRDSVGATRYESTMFIDLSEMALISLSDLQDRRALLDHLVPKFREKLSLNLGSEVPEPAYFTKKGCAYTIPEKAIHLTEDQVKVLVIDLIKKVASLFISKSQTGYVKVVDIKVQGIDDPLNPSDETIDVLSDGKFSVDVLNQFLGSFYTAYEEVTLEDATALLSDFDESVKAHEKSAKDAKDAKNKAKNKAKKSK